MGNTKRMRVSLLMAVLLAVSVTPLMPAIHAHALDGTDSDPIVGSVLVDEAAQAASGQVSAVGLVETSPSDVSAPDSIADDTQDDVTTDTFEADQPASVVNLSEDDVTSTDVSEVASDSIPTGAEDAETDGDDDARVPQEAPEIMPQAPRETPEIVPQAQDESPQPTEVLTDESAITSSLVVTMAPNAESTTVADVAKASKRSGAAISLFKAHSKPNQRFRFERVPGSTYCRIFSVNSGLALSVEGDVVIEGARVVQRPYSGSKGQQWIVRHASDGLYDIEIAPERADATSLYLGTKGAAGALLLLGRAPGIQTTWDLRDTRTLADGTYRIASLLDGKLSLDLTRESLDNGANIEVFADNRSNAQRFAIEYDDQSGYYTIANTASGLVLDVSRASAKKGANVTQWTSKSATNQQWSIEPIGESSAYRIVSACSGLVLDVAGGKPKSGANVCQWTYSASKNQQWAFTEVDPIAEGCYAISAFRSKDFSLDVNRGSVDPFTNVQLWKTKSSIAQRFELLKYSSRFYTIRNLASGLYVSVMRSSSNPNANVDVEGGTNMDDGRLWEVLPARGGTVLRSATGLAIDIWRGVMKSGTNIIAYTPSNGANQRFVFRSIANDPVGVTQVAAEFQPRNGGNPYRLESLMVDGTPCVYLPQDAAESGFGLRYLPTKEDADTQIAFDRDAEFVDLRQGDEIDLRLLSKQSDGSYLAWIRTSGANDTRMLRFAISKGHSSIDSAIRHVYSHRGASNERYEHTFAAYDLAIAQGSKQVEQDVVASADGTLFVSHDASIKLPSGTVVSFDSATDSEIDEWKRQDGNHILRLADVIARYGSSVTYVVELKQAKGVSEAFDALLQRLDSSYRVVVQSFSPDVLSRFHGVRSGVTTLLLAGSQTALDGACDLPHVDIVSAHKSLMTEANVRKVHESGKSFSVWTLDTMPEIENAIRLGVDSYFTNCTAKAVSLELAHRA